MEEIKHKFVQANGVKLHVAEIGNGSSVVVFLHGFPEIWYSWRYQMIAVAKAGFKAIAVDFRGYGLSDPSPEPENTTFMDLVDDLLAILDALSILKVFLVGKDFGVRVASLFTILHPERIIALITIGVPFIPGPRPAFLKSLSEGMYISRWQEPGRAEADFGRFDTKTVVRNIYILFSRGDIPTADENQEIMDLVDESTPLPPWFKEDDLRVYADLYQKSGFRTALKVPYRSLNEETGIVDPKIEVPALLIMGEKDYSLKFPGVEDYLKSGKIRASIPNLEMLFLPEGCHFVQEQLPDEVNSLIVTFLRRHS